MGSIRFDGRDSEMDDRSLAHVQIVVSAKLRRHEAFLLTWRVAVDQGSGRHTLLVDNGLPLRLSFRGSRPVAINRTWVEEMLTAASRPKGLQLGDEPNDKYALGG